MSSSVPTGRSVSRRIVAAVAAIAMMLAGLLTVPLAAVAAVNTGIVVGGVTIEPEDTQLTVGDKAIVSGTWDATTAQPQAGDTFTAGLPPEFRFPESVPFQLLGEGGVVWGNCLTDPTTGIATCELTEAVSERPEVVQGTWQFEIEVIEATTAEDVEFDLNGASVMVPLPGGGGIDDGIELPGEVSKSGVMNANNWSMTWTVEVPGANMAGHDTVTLHDTLSAGHAICDPSGLEVFAVRGSSRTDVTDLVTTAPAAGATDFDITLTAPDGGFRSDVTYEVSYQTCTIDEQIDPEGTQYGNDVQIDGWGDAGVGTATVTNHPWQADLSKSGTVRGGSDRYSVVAWTVTVPGRQLEGKDGFTLTETLGDGHAVCADTISDLRIIERYGPSGQRDVDLSPYLSIATVAASEDAFTLRFDITDPQFAFRDADHRYIITYETCVTADELPEPGTRFTNTVDIDGRETSGTATVPGRYQGKTGAINSAAVTVDGIEYLPQTTMRWGVTIPGKLVEDIDEVLTLTDTLSETQSVCAAGDPSEGLASQMNLSVRAVDQVSGGGLGTVDLTDRTAVTLVDNVVTFEIDPVDLPIPVGTSDGFSREYQYVISYVTCTTSGGMDAPGTVYSNEIRGAGIDFQSSVTQRHSGSGTGTGVTRGSAAITKTLADTTGAPFVPADTVFTVHVAEIDPAGVVQNEYDLDVPLDGEPVSGLNARGTGWTIELTEPTFPSVAGVTFGTPVFETSPGVTVSDDGARATVALAPGSNTAVSLTNEALLGSMTITKRLEGGAAALVDAERTYTLNASIDTSQLAGDVEAQPDRELRVRAGETVTLADLPIGAVVTVSEVTPIDDDTLTWAEPVIAPATVEITAAHAVDPASVVVTNTVERTVGTFAVSKSVTGAQADNPAVPSDFTVEATWTQEGVPGTRTLVLPADGTPVPLGAELLIGTEVTLTEQAPTDGDAIAWGAPVWSGDGVVTDAASAVVTIGRDADATVSLENHAATSDAGISIVKGVAGAAAGEVAADVEFPVTASWTDAAGEPQSRELLINSVEPTVLEAQLPAGTVVTLTEGEAPQIDTVVWDGIDISGDGVTDAGDGVATVVVSDQQGDMTLVTIVNEATWAPGAFTLQKEVVGVPLSDPDMSEAVTVVATWTEAREPQSREIEVPVDGTPVEFPGELPHGTEVLLTELEPGDSSRYTWTVPTWSGDVTEGEPGSAIVTIGAAQTAQVTLENTAVESRGSITVTKSVVGTGALVAPDATYALTLSWVDLFGDLQERDVEVTADAPTTVDDIPVGVEITVAEDIDAMPVGTYWQSSAWSTPSDNVELATEDGSAVAVIMISDGPGAEVRLALENTIGEIPDLPLTGAGVTNSVVLALIALALIGFGVVLTVRRRRARV